MEYEVRFYFPKKELENITNMLSNISDLSSGARLYEKTMQFDHPNEDMSFYTKEIDGRFRIRVSKDDDTSKCILSWKRRLQTTTDTDVNKEEEYELSIDYNEYDNLMFIVENVLKMKAVESYERYRTIYSNKEIEISIDEYPFGIALEIESKTDFNPEENIKKWTKTLNLDIENAYRLSWDDKYQELCNEQNVEAHKDVLFDLPMPELF